MNEARLRALLREVPVPDEGAERRGLALAVAAFREREPATRRRRGTSPRRLALAIVVVALAAGLLLSLASASVRHWVGDVFSADVPKAHPGLAGTPGGGRLLVQSASGPWVVQADGSRRLLGDYGEATWSPHGLFVGVVSGRTLTAVEPGGTPHWSLTARAPVSDPRWAPLGERIAYRAGRQLRVTAADGTGDHAIDRGTQAVAPAWSPLGLNQVAYVDRGGRLRVADADSGKRLGSAPALSGVVELEWGAGATLLEASRSALRVRSTRVSKLAGTVRLGPGRRLPLPPGVRLDDAAMAPGGHTVASLVTTRGGGPAHSAVLLIDRASGAGRRLFNVPGRLTQLLWSPDSSRLLVAWPEADEWLFLPVEHGTGRAVGDVAAAFSPGGPAVGFPRVEGWCCSR